MRRFLLRLLFISAGLAASVSAQSNIKLEGYVYQLGSGSPLAGATVELFQTAYRTPTDIEGYFAFRNLPEGTYRLKVSAVGFETKTIEGILIEESSTRKINVYLRLQPYPIKGIEVEGSHMALSSDRVTVIHKEEIVESKVRDLSELLEKVEGVHIRKTGTVAGKTEVSIRGSAAKHVLVLLDGQKINPSGSGVADLSSIPLEMVERIEIHKGGTSAEYGPDALAGVINIITKPGGLTKDVNFKGEAVTGSWQTRIYNFMLNNLDPFDKLNLNFAYSNKHTQGDFDYNYEVGGVGNDPDTVISDTRANNHVNMENIFSSGLYRFSNKLKVSYSAQLYESSNGLPGRPGNQNHSAHVNDSRRLITTTLAYIRSDKFQTELDFGFSRFHQHFKDRESGGIAYDSRFVNDISTIHLKQNLIPYSGNNLKTGLEVRRDILYHDDLFIPAWSMKRTRRDNWAVYATDNQKINVSFTRIFENLVLDGSLRCDNAYTSKDSTSWQDTTTSHSSTNWSPKVGLALSKENEGLSYIMRVNYGKSFRLPSINSLFWKGDVRARGNPGLRPEKSEHNEAGMELSLNKKSITVKGGIIYFHARVTDLIVWVQKFAGIWQPENIASARINGHEEFISLELFDKLLSFKYQNTITDAVNRSEDPNEYNKRLVFSPRYLTNLTAGFNICDFRAVYNVRLVDKAYVLKANTKFYEAYRVDDLHLDYSIRIHGLFKLIVKFDIFNLRDEDYVLITHSPMPGREWNVGIALDYGEGNNLSNSD